MKKPFIVGVGGYTSNVGKTTLMCDLLRAFPGWEAIKTTRGHYRSCGKDPHSCCVSHLLAGEPLVRSGWSETYEAGKDTGRFWDAGAANVHWLIALETQVDAGIRQALNRVRGAGVFVEGNTFSRFVTPDYFVMVKRFGVNDIKRSAKTILPQVSALFEYDRDDKQEDDGRQSGTLTRPNFSPATFPELVSRIQSAIAENSFSVIS